MIELSKEILGHSITVTAISAGTDWNIMILGGCSPHIGSVSLAEYKNNTVDLRTFLRDTHKDQIVGDHFARTLAYKLHCTVCVSCGIHFDNPTPDNLTEIVSVTETLLSELSMKIQ